MFPRTFSLVCCVSGYVLPHVAFADLLLNEILEGYAVFCLVTMGAMVVTMAVGGSAFWGSLYGFWSIIKRFVPDLFEYVFPGPPGT